ncbi:hypothetical protein BOTBODRAFT_174558 [Botryobasidium botryosum FD-172 SS1]|uniref:Uncharacterized protein n=1 Tax=Botryobasidium botryosum (strain FD-172 SS1) TaxID=930990 RepID=A0A067MS87_BOTB1|nr:hypothetical protein BOTBODRAFT_174558 [Botryobasidium botryosum FD-172 SS1]
MEADGDFGVEYCGRTSSDLCTLPLLASLLLSLTIVAILVSLLVAALFAALFAVAAASAAAHHRRRRRPLSPPSHQSLARASRVPFSRHRRTLAIAIAIAHTTALTLVLAYTWVSLSWSSLTLGPRPCIHVRLFPAMSTSSANTVTVHECFRLYEQDGRRFELWFFNLSNYPVSPTHPDLINPSAPRHPGSPPPFPLQPDGTYGNRDWLMCTYPYDRDRPWLHFIPTRSMWETPPVAGVNGVLFLIALDQHDEKVWYRSGGDRGYIRSALRVALRDSWVVGVRHLKALAATATQFKNTPMWEEQHFNWVVLDRVSSFRVASKSFYDLQRWIAEIWGWAFMQEKLQGKIIHRRTLLSDTAIKLDRFTGVIMHWQRRDLEFEMMALRYGLPLYWLDNVTDPAAKHAPWIGLPGRGQEATRLHVASGYWSMGKDKDNESANLYSLRGKNSDVSCWKV